MVSVVPTYRSQDSRTPVQAMSHVPRSGFSRSSLAQASSRAHTRPESFDTRLITSNPFTSPQTLLSHTTEGFCVVAFLPCTHHFHAHGCSYSFSSFSEWVSLHGLD